MYTGFRFIYDNREILKPNKTNGLGKFLAAIVEADFLSNDEKVAILGGNLHQLLRIDP